MEIGKWQVSVRAGFMSGSINSELYVWRSDGVNLYYLAAEGGELVVKSSPYEQYKAVDIKPLLVTEDHSIREIIGAFVAFAHAEGMKTPDESFAKGALEKQGAHLDDLRRILKLTK